MTDKKKSDIERDRLDFFSGRWLRKDQLPLKTLTINWNCFFSEKIVKTGLSTSVKKHWTRFRVIWPKVNLPTYGPVLL